MFSLKLLGGALIEGPQGPLGGRVSQRRRLALLSMLALGRGRPVTRDKLLGLFWPEIESERARHSLADLLYQLRGALGESAILSAGGDLWLNAEVLTSDVGAFEDALARGDLARATALYHGPFLDGFFLSDAPEFERWVGTERDRLARAHAEALEQLAEAATTRMDAKSAVEWLRRLLEHDPFSARVVLRLMETLEAAGDRAAAIRHAQVHADLMREEVGAEPDPEVEALARRLQGRSERIALPATPRPPQAPNVDALRAHVRAAEPPAATPALEDLGARPTPVPTRDLARRDGQAHRWRAPGAAAGVTALVVLLGVASWPILRSAPPESVASVRELVLVADFVNQTGDSGYGDLVGHILRHELARSPLLTIVGHERISRTLRRMRIEPGTTLNAEIARELAIREQIKLVIVGDVRTLDPGLVISASVIEASSGDIIHGGTETARDSTEFLVAVERLANGIRQGIGESIATLQAGDSLWTFTTSSLPALRKYMVGAQAFQRGDYPTSSDLLEEAISLDPEFANAYLLLFAVRRYAGFPNGQMLPPLVHAYELRGRLSEHERYAIEASYELHVSGDVAKSIAAFRKHIDEMKRLPAGEAAWYTSFGYVHVLNDDIRAAEQILQEARVRFPIPVSLLLLMRVLHALDHDAEARQVLAELAQRAPEHPGIQRIRALLLADARQYDAAHDLAGQIPLLGLQSGLGIQADLDAIRGRLSEAIGRLRELRHQALERDQFAYALEVTAAIGRLRLLAGDSAGAAEVEEHLALYPVTSLDVLSRPYLPLALFFAEAGDPGKAQAWIGAYEREVPRQFQGPGRWMVHRARAAVHRADGELEQALAELRQATRISPVQLGLLDDLFLRTRDHPELARLYDELGAADSAIAVYERYLGVRSLTRTTVDAFELGNALERLAGLHRQRGDHAQAALYDRRLVQLWGGADPELRPRVDAARHRLARMRGG